MTFSAVIWAAVSSRAQAHDDRASIPNQLQQGRAVCQARGWRVFQELAVKGRSREFTSLDAAMRSIPELAELMQLAQDKKFNLLICYDLNRFRELQMPITKTLAMYGVQTYSITQPFEPVAPDDFIYYQSDTLMMATSLGTAMSNSQLNLLRRYYAFGMARRHADGYHWNNVRPFGYRKPAGLEAVSRVVLVQDARECAILLDLKHRYEQGASGCELARYLNERGIPAPRGNAWSPGNVIAMLTNPFYAGLVVHNRKSYRRDPLSGKRIVKHHPRAEWMMNPGQQEPLWTVEDYQHLVELRERRAKGIIGVSKNTNFFTRLLRCKCGRVMRVREKMSTGETVYECPIRTRTNRHGRVSDSVVITALREFFDALLAQPEPKKRKARPKDNTATVQAALTANAEARARFQRMAGRGVITEADLVLRNAELAAEREQIQSQLNDAAAMADRARRAARVRVNAAELAHAFDTLWQKPPKWVNAQMAEIVNYLVVNDRKITDIFVLE